MINDKKVLLVLGGISQLCDIVENAKKKGIHVIVTDYLYNSPAKKIADESYDISITDVEGIIGLCKERKIDGIMNYCIDPGQKPYQEICARTELPCYGTEEQFNIMTNKDLFKESCVEFGVDVVPSFIINEDVSADELDKIEYPVIIKPADGRASKGISYCYTKEDIYLAIKTALQFSKRKKVICEKYMVKPEVAVKYFVCNGHIYLTSMSDIYTSYSNGKRDYIWTQIFPSKYYKEYLKKSDFQVRNMIKGLGIKNGPLSFSGFVDEGKFRFIDPSFRMGGAQDWRIVAAISGINISEHLTDFALTGEMGNCSKIEKLDSKIHKKSSAILYFLVQEGKIGKIFGLDKVININSVIGYHLCHNEGDVIKGKGTSDQVLMRILLVCNNVKRLKKDIVTVQNLILVLDKNGTNMLLPNFDVNLI